jgi:hypothetical protein
VTPQTLHHAQRSRSYFEEKLRELRPFHPDTKADPAKAALVVSLQARLGAVNDAIRLHYVEEAKQREADAAPTDGRLF